MFEVGATYMAILNGQSREFTVLGQDNPTHPADYIIRWDDGDEEWAYPLDMKGWTMWAE